MTKGYRVDRTALRKPERTPQGFLRVEGYASRCGVFEYLNEDGSTRRELRLPEEVFRDDALRGFETAILTDGHPDAPVTADNVHRVDVGHVIGTARRDGDHVATSILITDSDVIAKVEAGDTGLSVGYAVDLDETPGVHPVYGRYDAVQRNLVINHLAVAVTPRAGDTARIRLDGLAVAISVENGASTKRADERVAPDLGVPHCDDNKEPIHMADEEKKQDDEVTELKAALESANKEIADLKAKLGEKMAADEAEAVKAEKERADAAQTRLDEMTASINVRVRALTSLRGIAADVLGPTYRADDKDEVQIKRDVAKRLDSTLDVNALSPAELNGHFKQLVASRTKSITSYSEAGKMIAAGRNDQGDQKAADKIKHDWDNQHLKTLNKGAR